MPRSFNIRSRWRLGLLALVLMAPFFVIGHRADAQKRKPAQSRNTQTTPGALEPPKKNLMKLTSSETAEGSSITIISDLPLNDYSAYRGGDRYYVLIPSADATRIVSGLRGRGFADVRTQKRGVDVLLSFRLLAGAAARVNQKFNRLEILITVPALVEANAATNSNNSNSNANPGTQANSSGGTGNSGRRGSGTRGQSRRGSSSGNTGGADSNSDTTSPETSGPNQTSSNPSTANSPDSSLVGPDVPVTQTETNEIPPIAQASPIVSPSPTPPSDQIAQVQPTNGMAGLNSEAPPATTPAVPSDGSSFGAQMKQNWLFILLAVVVAGLIAWVVFARSREDQSPIEQRIETIRDLRASKAVVEAPSKAVAKPVVKSPPKEIETGHIGAEEVVAPVIAAAVVADVVGDDSATEELEAKEIEPVKPVVDEQASEHVAGLLAGHSYDASVIGTEHSEARQMIAAELLAALAGRNLVRHERARHAFIKHGYFDDATRTLRTAESPAERASAARSLGLVRDDSGTPHLVAALEDPSPEVRRAAVESLAEVRDPAAVAPLEALRDREKNRKVPGALIQHAIEASVVGRMKVEPTAPSAAVQPTPLVDEPHVLPAVAESSAILEEPATEASPVSSVESAAQQVDYAERLAPSEPEPLLFEAPEVSDETESAQMVEAEVVDAETDVLVLGDVPEKVSEEVIEPVSAAEPVADSFEGTSDEWVDVDVSRDSGLRSTSRIPVQPVEEVLADETSQADVIPDVSADVVQPASEADDSSMLPLVATGAIIAGAVSVSSPPLVAEDERGLDVASEPDKEIDVAAASDKELDVVGVEHADVSADVLNRLASEDEAERTAAIEELGSIGGEDAFREISASFDDSSPDVRNAAARALFALNPDRAASFTRALREASPERRRNIGAALSSSGLATEAIGHLMGESREITYDAFSLLFLMAKAGEVQPLMRAVEEHPNNEVRLAVVKLLALSGQQDILPTFRRLAVRGSLPTEVRSAVMEAIYQISSQSSGTT